MRSLLLFICVGLTLLLAGCGTAPERRLAPPGVRITALDGSALVVSITNANTVPLVVNRATHTLYLGDERFGRLDDRSPLGVPALGSVSHAIPLDAALGARIRDRLAAGSGEIRATLESAFELVLSGNDTMTIKSLGGGIVRASR